MKIIDPEVKAEWLKRLRSGKIKQGHNQLGTPAGERCCLGVLCDIAVDKGIIGKPRAGIEDDRLYYGGSDADLGDSSLLPEQVAQWAFGPLDDPDRVGADPFNPRAGEHALAEWNDGQESYGTIPEIPAKTFSEIADLIERYL